MRRYGGLGSDMETKNEDLVQHILDLIDEQTKMLQRDKPMTEEEALAYRERFHQIKVLVDELGEEAKRRKSVYGRALSPSFVRRLPN